MFFPEMPPPAIIKTLDYVGNLTRETIAPAVIVNCAAPAADAAEVASAIAQAAQRGDGLLFLPYNSQQGNTAAIRQALDIHPRVFVVICGPDMGQTRADFHGVPYQGREFWIGDDGTYSSIPIDNPRREDGLFGFMRFMRVGLYSKWPSNP